MVTFKLYGVINYILYLFSHKYNLFKICLIDWELFKTKIEYIQSNYVNVNCELKSNKWTKFRILNSFKTGSLNNFKNYNLI